jgi:Ni,Fe-hydrogenase maturation factor
VTKKICIFGIGNMHTPEGNIPNILVDRLRTRHARNSLPSTEIAVSFVSLPFLDAALFNVMSECDILILIDTVVCEATVSRVEKRTIKAAETLPDCLVWPESHGNGICDILHLAMALNRLPATVVLWEVVVGSTQKDFQLAPDLAGVIPQIETQLYQELRTLALA